MIDKDYQDRIKDRVSNKSIRMAFISPDRSMIACGQCGQAYSHNSGEFTPGESFYCVYCENTCVTSQTGLIPCRPWAGYCKNHPFDPCGDCYNPSEYVELLKNIYESQALIDNLVQELAERSAFAGEYAHIYADVLQDIKRAYAYFTVYAVYKSIDKYTETEFANEFIRKDGE